VARGWCIWPGKGRAEPRPRRSRGTCRSTAHAGAVLVRKPPLNKNGCTQWSRICTHPRMVAIPTGHKRQLLRAPQALPFLFGRILSVGEGGLERESRTRGRPLRFQGSVPNPHTNIALRAKSPGELWSSWPNGGYGGWVVYTWYMLKSKRQSQIRFLDSQLVSLI
jgi:hypothetical protein